MTRTVPVMLRRLVAHVLVIAGAGCVLAAFAAAPSDRPSLGVAAPSTAGAAGPSVDVAPLLVDLRHWPGPVVTFRVRGDVPPVMAGWWREAVVWAEGVTGLELVEVTSGPADITVVPLPEHNGRFDPVRKSTTAVAGPGDYQVRGIARTCFASVVRGLDLSVRRRNVGVAGVGADCRVCGVGVRRGPPCRVSG